LVLVTKGAAVRVGVKFQTSFLFVAWQAHFGYHVGVAAFFWFGLRKRNVQYSEPTSNELYMHRGTCHGDAAFAVTPGFPRPKKIFT
jgi:hypothetical protein